MLTQVVAISHQVAMSHYEVDMKTYPSRTADQYVVRFPDGMRDAIKRRAAENGRSMNAEIVFHLRQIFAAERDAHACQS
ncbi:Arc family DNA-binding protein [Paracoccus versutus]|uniref:Arc family DNA-binding protein n=2 Tax=Paracoccus versutus TaxID=34007 RepID=UPI003CCA4519